MSNTNLTLGMVTREALRVLHQKSNFIGAINRQYDDQYARKGAKIGSSLKIRKPNQYTIRTGKTMNIPDNAETYETLTLATQKGVDLPGFSSAEMALDIDDFSKRYIEPAVSVLAAGIEADAFSMYKNVWQEEDNSGSACTIKNVLNARKKLTDSLTPNAPRVLTLNTQANVDLVDGLKGLFLPQSTLSDQYRTGMVGETASFGRVYENTLLPRHTVGSQDGAYVTNGATSSGDNTVTVATGTGTLKAGDIITFSTVYAVHPESKVSTGVLAQFVITTDYSGGAGDITISPTPQFSGATQNVTSVTGTIPTGATITVNGTASTAHDISLAFHEDAFTFVTADLELPRGVHDAARETMDGISMRMIQAYDIQNDLFLCRIDVLYGYLAVRPQLACRIASN